MTVDILGENLELRPERALYWPRERLLSFSDVHLGKAESLQSEGIPIPAESGATDLQRMADLIAAAAPREILILGDFIHHRRGWTADLRRALAEFLGAHGDIDWTLIAGNHERGSAEELRALGLKTVFETVERGPFVFRHGHESTPAGKLVIEGHVHPLVTLRNGPLKMKFPAFVLDRDRLTLPSFGTWTGGVETERKRGRRRFAAAGESVFEIRD